MFHQAVQMSVQHPTGPQSMKRRSSGNPGPQRGHWCFRLLCSRHCTDASQRFVAKAAGRPCCRKQLKKCTGQLVPSRGFWQAWPPTAALGTCNAQGQTTAPASGHPPRPGGFVRSVFECLTQTLSGHPARFGTGCVGRRGSVICSSSLRPRCCTVRDMQAPHGAQIWLRVESHPTVSGTV